VLRQTMACEVSIVTMLEYKNKIELSLKDNLSLLEEAPLVS
jgi:hypothetical protein